MGLERLVRLCDGVERDAHAVVDEIRSDHERVIALLFGLDFVPVAETVQSFVGVIVGEIHVKIRRIEFLVHLIHEQIGYFLFEHNRKPPLSSIAHIIQPPRG